MKEILKGGGVSPALVGAARGVLEAAVLAALGAVAWYLNGDSIPASWAPFVPLALLLIRAAEGYVDHRLDPSRTRVVDGTVTAEPVSTPPDPQP